MKLYNAQIDHCNISTLKAWARFQKFWQVVFVRRALDYDNRNERSLICAQPTANQSSLLFVQQGVMPTNRTIKIPSIRYGIRALLILTAAFAVVILPMARSIAQYRTERQVLNELRSTVNVVQVQAHEPHLVPYAFG